MAPETEAELAAIVTAATGPLRVVGGGTQPIGAPVTGELLSTAQLTGISLYESGALTIVAQAGTPLEDITAALDGENQRLPFEPMDYRPLLGTGTTPAPGGTGQPTIGGTVAANASGPRRIQAGACRDSLIGVRFVDGSGDIIKNGGRVMKNVTGYDLVKLMAGSRGTLGILTEVAFKVLPGIAASATLRATGLKDAQAIALLSKALGSPFEVSGAAHDATGPDPVTLIRLEGFDASVAYRTEQLTKLLSPLADITVDTGLTRVAYTWRSIRDAVPLADRDGDVWRISVKPSDGPQVAVRLGPVPRLYDWGGGLVSVLVAPGSDVRTKLQGLSGHATLIRASDATRAVIPPFHPEPAAIAQLSQGLRQQFDPRQILNPGLMA
ncbi:FAD-binding protein [Actibacterium sp. 188UL27-1]|uniref:FAD-binding protein n=1 Tax=Actibacterium sp. 188UL27-1 TaxID=2786961 RepID=UPI0019579D09|nr:FAD-binding protein [Actibacterium sp. 188UL27-1]MBM7066274.1 FAD-binding protein [Actibacterium sp. 188UL27-1]